jgi:antitoxin component of MazEF toxin-antitoxin module
MERAMRVFRLDDSLVVRLPEPLVEEMGIAAGDEVNLMSVDNRTIAISKADQDADFVRKLRALQKPTPEGFVWNRDDANAR